MKTFICTKYNLNIHRWQSSWIMNLHANILRNHEKRKKWYISIKACSKDTKVLCRFWVFQFLYYNYINPGNLKENHNPGNFHSFTSRYLGKSLRPFWDSSLCRMAIIPSGMVGEIKWDRSWAPGGLHWGLDQGLPNWPLRQQSVLLPGKGQDCRSAWCGIAISRGCLQSMSTAPVPAPCPLLGQWDLSTPVTLLPWELLLLLLDEQEPPACLLASGLTHSNPFLTLGSE